MPGRSNNTSNPHDAYKFTGKELDQENGIDLAYFGARYYDPEIGRWLSVDPDAMKYPGLSPYNYTLNNPIRLYDPNGSSPNCCLNTCCWVPVMIPLSVKELEFRLKLAFAGTVVAAGTGLSFEFGPEVGGGALSLANKLLANPVAVNETANDIIDLFNPTSDHAMNSDVWALDKFQRGREIEKMLGGDLPSGFPVIDKVDNGVATSIKSIDVTAKTYTKGNALFNLLKGYTNKLADFKGREWGGIAKIEGIDFTKKELEVAIQPGKATLAQWEQISNAMKYAQSQGIEFNLQFIK